MYQFRNNPLAKMRLTQPFGVDYIGGGFYTKLGLKGHNGWDLSSPSGNIVYAVADGRMEAFTDGGYGVNARLTAYVDTNTRLEIVYGHLKEVSRTGIVFAGDAVALSDNTGLSTAPHLHFGVRPWVRRGVEDIWDFKDYNNGYFGYVDPQQFYPLTVFDLPVDYKYGNAKPFISEVDFYPSNVWFLKNFKRLMNTREYNAFRFGAWDARTVTDPAMFPIWSEFTKPEAKAKGII